MSMKSHNLTPLANRILEIVASYPDGITRNQIGEALKRPRGIAFSNDILWLNTLIARGYLTCANESANFKPQYVYRIVKR